MRRQTVLTLTAILGAIVISPAAQAHRGPGPQGPPPGPPPEPPGMGILMHAPGDTLKERLGISDSVLGKIESLRDKSQYDAIAMRADLERLQLKLRKQLARDLPDLDTVLKLVRREHALLGKLAEERIKSEIRLLALLDKGQRAKLREHCRKMPYPAPQGRPRGPAGHAR